jgi:hypothetical protein
MGNAEVKVIPSPDPAHPSLRRLVFQKLEEHRLDRSRNGWGWVQMGGNLRIDLTPFTPFTPRRIVEAWFTEAAWNVPPVKVISEERKL